MKCKICGFEGKSLVSHITRKHNISVNEYKTKYNVDKVHMITDTQKKVLAKLRLERKDDPYWIERMNKNRTSVWKKEYWISIGYTEEDATEMVRKYQSNNSKKRNYVDKPSWMNKKYWISKGYDDTSASVEISKRQSKISSKSKKFYGKSHTDETKLKISEKMKNHIKMSGVDEWASHFGDFTNYRSSGEIEIFDFVNSIYKNAVANQFILDYNVDILVDNKIIEFFGDFWHGLPTLFNDNDIHPIIKLPIIEMRSNDAIKIKTLKENGYDVLIVIESEFLKDKNSTFNEIKNFLSNGTP